MVEALLVEATARNRIQPMIRSMADSLADNLIAR
jgi:hypothetical protein